MNVCLSFGLLLCPLRIVFILVSLIFAGGSKGIIELQKALIYSPPLISIFAWRISCPHSRSPCSTSSPCLSKLALADWKGCEQSPSLLFCIVYGIEVSLMSDNGKWKPCLTSIPVNQEALPCMRPSAEHFKQNLLTMQKNFVEDCSMIGPFFSTLWTLPYFLLRLCRLLIPRYI